jgi:hypothetical protein
MIRKFELCSLTLVGVGSAKAATNGFIAGDLEPDLVTRFGG